MSLDIVKKLKPAKFRYKKDAPVDVDNKIHMGFIAQDLLKQFGDDFAITTVNESNGFLMIRHEELIAPLTKAVQELLNKVNILENKIKILEEKNE